MDASLPPAVELGLTSICTLHLSTDSASGYVVALQTPTHRSQPPNSHRESLYLPTGGDSTGTVPADCGPPLFEIITTTALDGTRVALTRLGTTTATLAPAVTPGLVEPRLLTPARSVAGVGGVSGDAPALSATLWAGDSEVSWLSSAAPPVTLASHALQAYARELRRKSAALEALPCNDDPLNDGPPAAAATTLPRLCDDCATGDVPPPVESGALTATLYVVIDDDTPEIVFDADCLFHIPPRWPTPSDDADEDVDFPPLTL